MRRRGSYARLSDQPKKACRESAHSAPSRRNCRLPVPTSARRTFFRSKRRSAQRLGRVRLFAFRKRRRVNKINRRSGLLDTAWTNDVPLESKLLGPVTTLRTYHLCPANSRNRRLRDKSQRKCFWSQSGARQL